MNRRKNQNSSTNQKDSAGSKVANDNLVIVPLPKFALSKSTKNDQLNVVNDGIESVSVQNLDAHPKEGLRNFSYKLSMSGEYEHIYARDHFLKMNKA